MRPGGPLSQLIVFGTERVTKRGKNVFAILYYNRFNKKRLEKSQP
jgi:hypothetical protein